MSIETTVDGGASDPPPRVERNREPRVFWAVYAAGWGIFLFGYFVMILLRSRRSVLQAAVPALEFTLPAALLGVGVVHLARRMDWPPGSPIRFSLLHLASASAYSLLWGSCLSLAIGVQRAIAGAPFEMPSFDNTLIALHLLFGLVVYGAITGGTYLTRVGRRLRAERERAAEAEALRAREQFRALRARLNPHFLFNSLHSVLSLIRRAPGRAERAVEHLGELLRYAVGSEAGERPERVTLGTELEMVKTYLELEEIRLDDRLTVEREVPEEARGVPIPPLTVQPLVENAVRHGISEMSGGGTLQLRARLVEDAGRRRLRLLVSDDGPGADPESLRASDGLGLSLVRRRLELLYGEDAELRLETGVGEGFTARVTVPADGGDAVLQGRRAGT